MYVHGSCNFNFWDEFVFRDYGSFAGGLVDEKKVKDCAERFGWGVGSVFTTAIQENWIWEGYMDCQNEVYPNGLVDPIVE